MPVSYQICDTRTWSDHLLQLADSYFFLGGNKAFVIGKEFTAKKAVTNCFSTYKHEKFFVHDEKVSYCRKTALIASYFFSLGILPLILLVTKTALRCMRNFESQNVLNNPIIDEYESHVSKTIQIEIIKKKFKEINAEEITIVDENDDYNTYKINEYPDLLIKLQHNKNTNILQAHHQDLIKKQKMKLIKGENGTSFAATYTLTDYFVLIEKTDPLSVQTTPYKEVTINDYSFLKDLEDLEIVEDVRGSSLKEVQICLTDITKDIVFEINHSMRKKTSHKSYYNDKKCHLYVDERKNSLLYKYKNLYYREKPPAETPPENNHINTSQVKFSTSQVKSLVRKIIEKLSEKNIVPWAIELHY